MEGAGMRESGSCRSQEPWPDPTWAWEGFLEEEEEEEGGKGRVERGVGLLVPQQRGKLGILRHSSTLTLP